MSGYDAAVIIATKSSLGHFEGFWAEENVVLKNLNLKNWDLFETIQKTEGIRSYWWSGLSLM